MVAALRAWARSSAGSPPRRTDGALPARVRSHVPRAFRRRDEGLRDRAEEEARQLLTHVDLNHPLMKTVCVCIRDYRYTNDVNQTCERAACEAQKPPSDLNFDDIQKKIERGALKLPEMPAIVVKLNEVINDPHASASDVAQIVSSSPSLSTILLKMLGFFRKSSSMCYAPSDRG